MLSQDHMGGNSRGQRSTTTNAKARSVHRKRRSKGGKEELEEQNARRPPETAQNEAYKAATTKSNQQKGDGGPLTTLTIFMAFRALGTPKPREDDRTDSSTATTATKRAKGVILRE